MKLWDYKDYEISSIIVKASDYCNLRCDYCYQKERNTNKVVHIDQKLVKKTILDYFSYAETHSKNNILYMVWHGGEPLICGLEFYEIIVKIQNDICNDKPYRIIYNAVQTNGTLLSEKYLEFFKKNKFGIGISIDGIPKHHDMKRHFENKKGSYELINQGVERLKKYGMHFTSICVISKQSMGYAKEYYDFFKGIETVEVDFIPSFFQNSDENLTNEEYYCFLKELFDLYYMDSSKTFAIRVLDDILRAILSSHSKKCGSIGCEYAGRCGENISLSVEGDVYPCDCLTTSPKFKLGNIFEHSLKEIMSNKNKNFALFQSMVNEISDKCIECSVYPVCKGGCFNRRVQNLNDFELGMEIYCEARKKIITYIGEKCYASV